MVEYDGLKDELLAITDTALKFATSLDSSAEFEVFLYHNSITEAKIEQGVVTAKDGIVLGNAVRAAKGKRVGFACASGTALERVKLSIKEALSIIDTLKVEDDKFEGFCDSRPPGNEGLFDKEYLELGTEDLLKYSEEMIADAKAVDPRVKIINADASVEWGAIAVGNTRGVLQASMNGGGGCSVDVTALVGDERKTAFDFDVTRERLFRTDGLGKKAAEDAVALLGAKKLDMTEKMTTVWSEIPAATFFMASLGQSVLGQPVVEGISPLCDMIGDTVASKDLTVIDNGQKPEGLGTTAIDHEGHPQMRNPLIENGVLKGFLFNSYFGWAFGVESTGNCKRGRPVFGGSTPYENSPNVSTKWLEISPGKVSEADAISQIDGTALYIAGFPLGIFHSSVATGEFSIVAGEAYLVENGEIKHPVQPVSIGGNFYDGLKNLRTICDNIKPLPWGIEVPSLVFDGFSVTG